MELHVNYEFYNSDRKKESLVQIDFVYNLTFLLLNEVW